MSSSHRRWLVAVAAFAVGCGSGDVGAPSDGGESGDEPIDLDTFPGLTAPVDISIDDRGIPHIFGQTDLDVSFAAGYQMATDRLFQMDLIRRRALGRQAEVLGPDKIGQDELSRLMDFRRWGTLNIERLRAEDPDVYRLVVAWLAGVNRRIGEVRDGTVALPMGFRPQQLDYLPEPWTMEDHFAIAKMIYFGQSSSLEKELLATILQQNFPDTWRRVEISRPMFPISTMPEDERPTASSAPPMPRLAPTHRGTFPPEELHRRLRRLHDSLAHVPKTGSNNWAIDGRHTQSGRPLIAGDPHQPLQSPSLMYAQHMNSVDGGGTIDVIGWSFAGAAGVHLGHNRHLHWTATTNFADVMDIWDVELVGGDQIRVGGQLVELVTRRETIEVAGEAPQTYVVHEAPGFGVILPDDLVPIPVAAAGRALLLGWTGFRATNEERSFMKINAAEDLAQFEAAVDLQEVSGFNFIAADATGIAYRVHILVPDRGDPAARPMPFTVIDGDDPATLWNESFLPPERLPHSRGQTRGFLATANNDPWGFTFDGDVGNDPWYYGFFFAAGHRAKRIDDELTRLTARGSLTVQDMQVLQLDTHSVLADALVPVLDTAWAAVPGDETLAGFRDRPGLQTLAELLTGDWDRQMRRDSAAALVFHVWLHYLAKEAVGDDLSILFDTVLAESPPFILKIPALAVTGAYPESEGLLAEGTDMVVLRALENTEQFMIDRFGGVDPARYVWGDLHGTMFTHAIGAPLEVGFVPSDGGEDTVNVSSSTFFSGAVPADRLESTDGPIFRVVTTFDDDGWPRAVTHFPPGNGGDPESGHWDDSVRDWTDGRYRPLPFRRSDVEAATIRRVFIEM